MREPVSYTFTPKYPIGAFVYYYNDDKEAVHKLEIISIQPIIHQSGTYENPTIETSIRYYVRGTVQKIVAEKFLFATAEEAFK